MIYFRAKPEFIIGNYVIARETARLAMKERIIDIILTSHIIMSVVNSVQSAIVPCGDRVETTISDCEDEVFLTENFLHCLC